MLGFPFTKVISAFIFVEKLFNKATVKQLLSFLIKCIEFSFLFFCLFPLLVSRIF